MVPKKELIRDLKEYLSFEEEIIGNLSDFYKALGWRRIVKKEYHGKIESGLDILKQDSTKHAQTIREMLEYVEASGKDEF